MAGYQYKGTEPWVPNAKEKPYKPRYVSRPKRNAPNNPELCGEMLGYYQHKRLKNPICQPCRDSYNTWQANNRAKNRAAHAHSN